MKYLTTEYGINPSESIITESNPIM